jgi:hypothetical protein
VHALRLLTLVIVIAGTGVCVHAQVGDYEGRSVSAVEVTLEGTPADTTAQNEFKSILRLSAGGEYSAVNVRPVIARPVCLRAHRLSAR